MYKSSNGWLTSLGLFPPRASVLDPALPLTEPSLAALRADSNIPDQVLVARGRNLMAMPRIAITNWR